MRHGRGRRQPDNIGLELDRILDADVKKAKFKLLTEIKENFFFQQLTQLAHGVSRTDNECLARHILEARWNNMSVAPVVEKYAQLFIYPHRRRVQ